MSSPYYRVSLKDLDFKAQGRYLLADTANIGYAFMKWIERYYPDANWNTCPTEVLMGLLNRLEESGDALQDCAESLEFALGRLGCPVEANDGGGGGKHDAESFGGIATLRRAREVLRANNSPRAPKSSFMNMANDGGCGNDNSH